MSQKNSSMGSDNPEFKYKKALLQIQKIHNANKELKRQSEEMKMDYERQVCDLGDQLALTQKDLAQLRQDKEELQKEAEELQLSHEDIQEENNNIKRELKYLNDALNDQTQQLKKVEALKSQKGLSGLIASYEDKELSYRKEISHLQEMNKNLKRNFDTLDEDLGEERRQKFKLQDLNNGLRMEMAKYRQLNQMLLAKNQNIVYALLNRSAEGKEKFKEAEAMLFELGRQLQIVKTSRIQQQGLNRAVVAIQNYQLALHQKGKLEGEVGRLRGKVQEGEDKLRGVFEVEERMKRAEIRAEQLQEEVNMLKGKLIVLETKEVMQGEAEYGDLKQLQQKLMSMPGQVDPLAVIKNGSDSSHFQLMKSYILDLKEKLSKAVASKREYEKKYRSMKDKLVDKAGKSISFEEQNKMLRGKVQGYERLTERLQFQLQKNIQEHEEELSKMKGVTNNIITKKTEEVKVANAYVRAQLDLEYDKFQKTEKGLRQQLETVKLELSTERIKNADLQDKYNQASQFLSIYQKKFNDVTASNEEVQQNNQALVQNATKYEQLYREERINNEVLLGQKNAFTSKLAQVSDQLQRRNMQVQELMDRTERAETELKKNKAELTVTKTQLQSLQNMMKVSRKEFEDKSRVAMLDISRTQTGYYTSLESNYNQERDRSRELQAEVQALKLRLERALIVSQKVPPLEDQLNAKNDELSDYKRKNILTEKQISVQEAEMREIRNQFDILRRENNGLKAKLMESGQQIRRSTDTKDLQGKKAMQKMNQQLSSALSELREERRLNSRLQSDVQNNRGQIQRLTTSAEQAKTKELHLFEEMGQLRNSFEALTDEGERLKSELKYRSSTIEGLNSDIATIQDRVYKITQENTQNKMRKDQFQNDLSDLKREVLGLKAYLSEVQNYGSSKVASGNWQEQRDRDNIANFAQKVKKILKKAEQNSSQTVDYLPSSSFQTSYNATPSYVQDYMKNYSQPLFSGYAGSYKGTDLDLKVNESPGGDSYGTFRAGMPFTIGEYN